MVLNVFGNKINNFTDQNRYTGDGEKRRQLTMYLIVILTFKFKHLNNLIARFIILKYITKCYCFITLAILSPFKFCVRTI